MKQLLILFLFAFLVIGANAQSFPLPGATWFFDATNSGAAAYGQQLEYLGDSIVPNGIIKKMKRSAKMVNPDWYAGDTTLTFVDMQYFRYAGDSIFRRAYFGEEFVCNFALAVGDSSYTPYYNEVDLLWLQGGGDTTCTQVDTAFVYHKGIVSEAGMETSDGVTYRYYKLLYTDDFGNPDSVTFSERSIITADYWYRSPHQMCTVPMDPIVKYLLCFSDDSSAVPCAEADWYAHLGLDDPALSWKGEVYPNPAAGSVMVSNPAPYAVIAQLTDLDGRTDGKHFEVAGNASATIDLSAIANGTYIVSLQTTGGVIRKRLVVVNP